MGSGRWDTGAYTARGAKKAAAGESTFHYSDTLRSTAPRESWKAHETLKPSLVAGPTSPNAGKVMREAFDSDEHPESLPIAVIFDVTGSMHQIPQVLQKKLPQLYGMLMRKGYVEHPQMLFGAVGDATCDSVPLQIGQFESDNRADENLENLVLEGGGGGGNHESYQLAAYFMARHTVTDSYEKRGKKGYLFLIGDERVYDTIDPGQVRKLIGDELSQSLSTAEIFEELRQKWEVFFLFARQGSYQPEQTIFNGGHSSEPGVCYWRDLLGQNAMILDDAEAVCETIALTIGLMEGVITLDEGADHLKEIGADVKAIGTATKALATVGAATGAVAKSEGTLPEVGGEEDTAATGTTRL